MICVEPPPEEVAVIYAGVNGFLDDIPTPDVARFQEDLRQQLRTEGDVLRTIRETKDLDDATAETLNAAIKRCKTMFGVEAA